MKRRSMIWRLRNWWNAEIYIPIYCKLSMFQLLKHKQTNEFIVIWWSRRVDPNVSGFSIVAPLVFPWAWKRTAEAELFWDKLMRTPGMRDVMRKACKDSESAP